MIKVKPDGSLEVGEQWNLTEDDLEELAAAIGTESCLPTLKKLGGRWVQDCPADIMDRGFRVFIPGDSEEQQNA